MTSKSTIPNVNEGELLVKFGRVKGEHDLFYYWPKDNLSMSADSRILMFAIERIEVYEGKTLRKLLEERGYDMNTFKLTVRKRKLPEINGNI